VVRAVGAAAAVIILVAGLSVRHVFDGAFAKYAGDALYAALIYALALVVAPRARAWQAAAIATTFCWIVEFAQLTPYPARLSDHSGLARLVLGSTFNAPDLFWYVVGVAATAVALEPARARVR
jgi:hypothetical protein